MMPAQRDQLNRRSFIAFLGSALAWSDDVRSQEPRVPVIGFLNPGSSDRFAPLLDAFRQGLSDGGYVEGRNVAIEYRWADDQFARLPELAADLVRRRVSLIAATGGVRSAHAAKTAKATMPVLFIGGPDPVAEGLVSSLNSPNSNFTGVAIKTSELIPKRQQLLLELIPGAKKIALLLDRNTADADAVAKDFEATAREFGRQPILLKTGVESDLEPAFVSAVQQRVDGLLVAANPFFTIRRSQVVALAARHALPTAYSGPPPTLSGSGHHRSRVPSRNRSRRQTEAKMCYFTGFLGSGGVSKCDGATSSLCSPVQRLGRQRRARSAGRRH